MQAMAPLNDPLSATATRRYLPDEPPAESCGPAEGGMKKAASVPAMDAVGDMAWLREEMDAPKGAVSGVSESEGVRDPATAAAATTAEADAGSGGFFIDGSDKDTDSSLSDCFLAPPSRSISEGSGARRAKSLAGLSSTRTRVPAQDIHTIHEAGGGGNATWAELVDVSDRRSGGNKLSRALRRWSSTPSHKSGRTPEVGLDASVTSRRPFARRSSSRRTPEVGLDASVTSRKSFRRVHSSVSIVSSRTPEVGLDESVTSRKPFVKRSMSTANMNGGDRIPETVLLRPTSLPKEGSSRRRPLVKSISDPIPETLPPPSGMAPAPMPLRSSMKHPSSLCLSHRSAESSAADALGTSGHSGSGSDRLRRSVSFSSLEIRHHPMTLGDCPTSSGPPVALAWDHAASEEHSIDEYESAKAETGGSRNKRELLMPPSHRHHLLLQDAGFARGEIRAATDAARRTARGRERTARAVQMGLAPVEEAWEKARRGLGLRRGKVALGVM